MKQFKIKKFNNEAKQSSLKDELLIDTINNFLKLSREEQKKFALGAGLFKLRIASKEGRGKSGGSRSILAFKKDNGVFWLHLFAKNDKGNVTTSELKKLKHLADIMLSLTEEQIERLKESGELFEVNENV
ncbi:hypothetical protein A6J40_01870 [Legionella longbeachae]|uniref:type II toxin-antitoxin system RelE/ParE family toxin n=1 Tax=Legionella longbeachae TaxID=450 RepID=UPI0009B74A0B|nr:type II toxin-antitoxin system RelE/ParE family toxin [Legionella longbeachae]VEE02730.1 Uncharacterized protein conserved in bacteria [Legionella oakridgensis]ARB91009.1 hypothetical protein A6J40_01870 [Legionella longbeachae]ARM32564.1 type II toxin-antitoxin system RelE/ParE family toxin [Legionella longbeachae]RZV21199.1 type II toxin-antitoxin system RelE/ParE family toxin [Legionella longbeachae]UAK45791.1 type II toxin-antitoxin system RelE/ParE family toxin [Legionella longbeachae]